MMIKEYTDMKNSRFFCLTSALIFVLLFCCACGSSGGKGGTAKKGASVYQPGQTSVSLPSADGDEQAGGEPLLLDFSNAAQGYFMGKLTGEGKKVNIQVTGPDDVIYKYFLETPDTWTAFPLTAGSGPYLVLAFEDIGSDQYASLFSYPLDVTLDDEFLPFLYPNQYVNFTSDCEAVSLAASLSADQETDLDALRVIYDYVISHITYDNEKAATVESGYLPDIDETLSSGTGICFDYAALMASMLRSLSIPTRLAIGYSGEIRHAWIDVYIQSIGWVERVVEFNGDEWNFMDPTFASAGSDNEAIQEYIGDGDNYILQYVR